MERDSAKATPSTTPSATPEPRMIRDGNISIIKPISSSMAENGVILVRKDSEVDVCIKLPIKVKFENKKMKIIDGDIASISKKMVIFQVAFHSKEVFY